MIVVRKEDHAKLAILGIALTGVLSFSGYRVLNTIGSFGSSHMEPKPIVAQPTTTPIAPAVVAKPIIVTAYAEMPAPKEPDPFRAMIVTRNPRQLFVKAPGALPGATMGSLAPMGVDGPGVQIVQQPPLRLDGVLAGRSSAAIVTMGDRTDVLALGGSLGEYTLTRVDRQSATFECKRGPVRLLVGEEAKPPTPPPAKLPPVTLIG